MLSIHGCVDLLNFDDVSLLSVCSERHERRHRHLLPESGERSGTSPTPSFLILFGFSSRGLKFSSVKFSSHLNIPNHLRCPSPQGILNHCFDDIENFMGKLQQTAEAAIVLNQRKKKKKKSKKQSAEGEGN